MRTDYRQISLIPDRTELQRKSTRYQDNYMQIGHTTISWIEPRRFHRERMHRKISEVLEQYSLRRIIIITFLLVSAAILAARMYLPDLHVPVEKMLLAVSAVICLPYGYLAILWLIPRHIAITVHGISMAHLQTVNVLSYQDIVRIILRVERRGEASLRLLMKGREYCIGIPVQTDKAAIKLLLTRYCCCDIEEEGETTHP